MFTFGTRNRYFSFAFTFELGSPSLVKENQSNAAHVAPIQTVSSIEQLDTPAIGPAVTVSQQQHDTSTPPYPSLQAVLDAQLHAHRTATNHGNGNHLVPSIGDTSQPLRSQNSPRHPKSFISNPISIPRTPKSAIRSTPNAHRTRRQATFAHVYGSHRHLTPLLPPRLKKPSKENPSKLLPSPPSSDTSSTPCSGPLSFQSLPLEIKHMIYHELLQSAAPIRKPHKLVCNKRSIMVDSTQPVKDIDSSILRVCRMIYSEAVPILYGRNTFEFSKPRKLRDFSHAGLDRTHPTFGFHDAPAGRFTLIRSVILRLGPDRKPYTYLTPGTQHAPDRKRIWGTWYQYFFNDNDPQSIFDWGMFPSSTNGFPALNKVVLDFTDWQLSEADAIRVEPFVKKLTRNQKLSVVAIKAVKNAGNLEEFRKGLVKPGGVFVAKD